MIINVNHYFFMNIILLFNFLKWHCYTEYSLFRIKMYVWLYINLQVPRKTGEVGLYTGRLLWTGNRISFTKTPLIWLHICILMNQKSIHSIAYKAVADAWASWPNTRLLLGKCQNENGIYIHPQSSHYQDRPEAPGYWDKGQPWPCEYWCKRLEEELKSCQWECRGHPTESC